jgi:hypothetical protein
MIPKGISSIIESAATAVEHQGHKAAANYKREESAEP